MLINGACLDMVTLGGSCVNSMQCPASAICNNAICSCPPGMVNNGGTCQQQGKLTLFCDSEENKKTEVDLECNATQVLVSGQCLNRAEIGQSCQATAQCNGGSSCASSICSCAAGQTIVNNVCTAGGNVCVCPPDYVTRFRNWKHYNMSDQRTNSLRRSGNNQCPLLPTERSGHMSHGLQLSVQSNCSAEFVLRLRCFIKPQQCVRCFSHLFQKSISISNLFQTKFAQPASCHFY